MKASSLFRRKKLLPCFIALLTITVFDIPRYNPTIILDGTRKALLSLVSAGSSGVRFSGDKVNVFNEAEKNILFDYSNAGKKQILFPTVDGDANGGLGRDCEQWAVVTTIHDPTPSIIGVSNLRNWCLVIVGDTITPDDAYSDLNKKENVFYLSAAYQKDFLSGSESKSLFMQKMPFKSFARKNIGYLFAIQYGAQIIFDFDDDNVLMPLDDGETIPPPLLHFGTDTSRVSPTILLKFLNPTQTVAQDQHDDDRPLAFNPYIYMGASQENSWPRGFPIDDLENNFMNVAELDTIEVGDLSQSSIGVIQSLCNGDPDTDAIFRMTRPKSTDFTFEHSAKSLPLLIPSNMYTPYNAQATTHLYSAFWGLYLPITVPGRVTDIWRSYITQRIMKDVGLYVMYTPPIVHHDRSAHDYLSDFVAESDLYGKTSKLLEFLNGWSSDANELPARIFDLWVELYERDYIGLDDVETTREWLNTLIAIGYEFPTVVDASTSSAKLMAIPQIQPSLDGQPYRSLPHFDAQYRPESAVVKLIMMTRNEWPLLKSWVLYHGNLLGFQHLYILDGSTDSHCTSFLRYARDTLGVNVMFSDANLNQLEQIMADIGVNIGGSSDVIIKMDTDEYLVVHDDRTNTLASTLISDYLSGFANDENHPLRLQGNARVQYVQGSVASEKVCKDDIHALPDKFPLGPIALAENWFKMVYDSKEVQMGRSRINLGGHAFGDVPGLTKFGIMHYHYRCVEIEVESSKQVLERHAYISPSDTDDEAKVKLAAMFGCSTEDICHTCDFEQSWVSGHKVAFYLKWLNCPEEIEKSYYGNGQIGSENNSDFVQALQSSIARFDVTIK